MRDAPLAYHFTFGTYGTRLHGGERPTVDRMNNQYGMPFVERDVERVDRERSLMRYDAIRLHSFERELIEGLLPEICLELGWQYHVAAAQIDHVHVLATAEGDSKTCRRLLKRLLTQRLNQQQHRERWWAKGGSIRWVWKREYFRSAYNYIERQRTTRG